MQEMELTPLIEALNRAGMWLLPLSALFWLLWSIWDWWIS